MWSFSWDLSSWASSMTLRPQNEKTTKHREKKYICSVFAYFLKKMHLFFLVSSHTEDIYPGTSAMTLTGLLTCLGAAIFRAKTWEKNCRTFSAAGKWEKMGKVVSVFQSICWVSSLFVLLSLGFWCFYYNILPFSECSMMLKEIIRA